jgi:hypothetical protein
MPTVFGFLAVLCGTSVAGVPFFTSQDDLTDFQECSRQCRFAYGFYNRSIAGVRVLKDGKPSQVGENCQCNDEPTLVPRISQKPWDEEFWCGGFDTDLVCILNAGSDVPTTSTRAAAQGAGQTIMHCGRCAACSNLHDLDVLNRTKEFITTKMTACSTEFAKPAFLGGHRNLTVLRQCLEDATINFSTDGRSWPISTRQTSPSCMDCWTDNIMCDAVQCKLTPDCILKFLDPKNSGQFAGCLKCDESKCGPEFIRCAGANRRASGIVSDIGRPSEQICTVGYYYSEGRVM